MLDPLTMVTDLEGSGESVRGLKSISDKTYLIQYLLEREWCPSVDKFEDLSEQNELNFEHFFIVA